MELFGAWAWRETCDGERCRADDIEDDDDDDDDDNDDVIVSCDGSVRDMRDYVMRNSMKVKYGWFG